MQAATAIALLPLFGDWFRSARPCGPRLFLGFGTGYYVVFRSTRPCGPRPIDTMNIHPYD